MRVVLDANVFVRAVLLLRNALAPLCDGSRRRRAANDSSGNLYTAL